MWHNQYKQMIRVNTEWQKKQTKKAKKKKKKKKQPEKSQLCV